MALATAPRRSARLGSHCIVATRKRPRISDSEQHPAPSSSKLPLDPSPRWIRAQKRQKIVDATTASEDGKTKPGKCRSLIPDDHETHHGVVRKKRKENIVNDALAATAKISITLDTRQGGGNNPPRRHRNADKSQASKSRSKPSCHPSSTRMMTRTMKKLSSDAITQTQTSAIPSSSQSIPTSDAANDTQPISHDTVQSSLPLLLPKSPDISISMPMSFMNIPLSLPLNFAPLNMSIPLSVPLNIPVSTTLAPSESELGFGFHPQEQFSSTARDEGEDREEHVLERPQTTNETSRPSSPPQSCPPCLTPISTTPTIPPRLAISTSFTSPTISPTSAHTYSSSHPSSPTSPTYSSPLKAVCFPGPPKQSFSPTSQWQPSPSASQQLPSLPALSPSSAMNGHEHRMKDWAMDMADDQLHSGHALGQEMGMGLALSFRNSSTGQGDELRLAQLQEQDRSPLPGPAPQPSSPQLQAAFPPLAPSSPSCPQSTSSRVPLSSSRQYHKKIEYHHHQMPEWTPKLDKERNLWKLACKIRVWEITKRYSPDTIRTVVAQEAHDYYSVHGFPIGYGSVPVRSRKRRWKKNTVGAVSAAAGSESDCASSCSSILSPPSPTTKDDEFMNEETYNFELMDDDDDMDVSLDGLGIRSLEDEWRYEGLEEEFGFEDYDEDDDDDDYDDDIYEEDEAEEVDGDQTKIAGNRKKKGVQSCTTAENQDQDPDGEGEMEIDIEPFQDPSFNAELSSPTCPAGSPKLKSKSKSNAVVANEPQSFVSSFYIPSVHPHMHHVMQMQQQRQEAPQQQVEEVPVLAPPSSTNPLSSSTEGTSISTSSDTADHTATAASNNDNTHIPMQIHLPPFPPHPHHYHPQLVQLSPNILPLPPPRLDSVRVFILCQSEMGGLKTTGRGTPADRKRGAIWGGIGSQVGAKGSGGKRGLDNDGKEREGEGDEEIEGEKKGRPRLRLMLSDHDIQSGPRRGRSRQGEVENGAKTTLRLSLPCDPDERMPIVPTGFKCDTSESSNANNHEDIHKATHKPPPPSTSTFVATDQTWDAFLASLEDKSQPQQQGEEGRLDSSVAAANSDGQFLLDLDGHRHRHCRHESDGDPPIVARRLGPLSPTLEFSNGMFMFDQGSDDSSSPWFGVSGGGGEGASEGGMGIGKSGISAGGLVGSSGSCPSDALALEGFHFPVGPDGSSTLSYALG